MPVRRIKRASGKIAYQADIRIGGKRLRRDFETAEEARYWEGRQIEAKRRARCGLPQRHTLEDALARFLTTDAQSLRSYHSIVSLAGIIRPFLTGKYIEEAGDVATEIKKTFLAEGLTHATINRRLALLRRICNLAFKSWGWVDTAYGQRVQLLPENQDRHYYLTPEEIESLASACDYPPAGDAVRLAAYTGLRQGEILNIKPGQYRDGWIYLRSNTKSGRPRAVPVPKHVQHIAAALPLALDYGALRKSFELARREVGLPHIRFHDTRHAYASMLADAGSDLREIKELMGHSTMQMTARYSHLTQKRLQRAVRRLKRGKKG